MAKPFQEEVVLVDAQDHPLGVEEKLAAHLAGKLHRAVSVLLFNAKGELLMQQRALSKYHSGGLWTNTCCGHPRPGETPLEAAERRLFEEMGIHCSLKKSFDFIYQTNLDHGLKEYEFDHVFIGKFEGEPQPDPQEASDWKWMALSEIKKDIQNNPHLYTVWFKILLPLI